MKSVKKHYSFVIFLAICLIAAPQIITAQNTLSAQDKKIFADFEKRAKNYVKLRKRYEKRLPKLTKNATPIQIETHKTSLQKAVQTARSSAKKGEIFTPATEVLIKTIISRNFKGKDLEELRETVMEADTEGVPIQVNIPYPETKEEVTMSPALLLRLPQLPPEVRYRFVGRNLLLVDRENELILDYMTNALP